MGQMLRECEWSLRFDAASSLLYFSCVLGVGFCAELEWRRGIQLLHLFPHDSNCFIFDVLLLIALYCFILTKNLTLT